MSVQVVRTGRFRSEQVWTRLDLSEQVVAFWYMFGHVRTCRNSTDLGLVGTVLDSSTQFGYRSGHVSTCLDRSEQVGTGLDMSVQIFGNRTDMSGQVCTGLDSPRQFGAGLDVSAHVGTGWIRS